jgi:glycosyltransferase involved in cell wall biosynthesis
VSNSNYKLIIYSSNPVQYQTPIYKELVKTNIDFTVLFGDEIGFKSFVQKETGITIQWDIDLLSGYKYKFMKNYSRDSREGFFSRINPSIYFELYKYKPEVVLIHGYDTFTTWFTLIAAKIINIKIIWRGESVLRGIENENSLKQTIKKLILKKFFKACDAVMYSCSGNKEYLKFYGVSRDKLFPFPCAVDNDFFQNERMKYNSEVKSIKKEIGIDLNDMVVLFSARFTIRKRPVDLLNALAKIDSRNITVLLVGDGSERLVMESFVKDNNIKAVFTGFQNQTEISKYYFISDVSVIISDYDPSPKTMNEVMNFELPIIVTDVVGTAYDLVQDGENGFIVNVGDIDTISKKIDFLNKNRDELKKMGKKSFETVQNWNYKEDVKGILDAFKHVTNL